MCFPLGRDGRVFGRGYHGVDHRPLGEPAVLGLVPRPLEVLEGGADHDLRVLGPELLARHGREIRELREREVDLRGRAAVPEVLQIRHDLRGQVLPADQREQGRPRVRPRDDSARPEPRAVHQRHAGRPPIRDVYACHLGFGADIYTCGTRGLCDGLRDAPPFRPARSPTPCHAVGVAHPVVEQHVGGAGAHRPAPHADDAPRREGALDPLVHEEQLQEVRARHGHQVHEPREVSPVAERVASERKRLPDIRQGADAGVWGDLVEGGRTRLASSSSARLYSG